MEMYVFYTKYWYQCAKISAWRPIYFIVILIQRYSLIIGASGQQQNSKCCVFVKYFASPIIITVKKAPYGQTKRDMRHNIFSYVRS